MTAEKRRRLEEALWSMHEADIGDYLETTEIDGKTVERPKHISELPRELQQNIEKITVLPNGRAVPQLYSKLAASQELRKMLQFAGSDDVGGVARMTDQELVAQLADLSKQLGVDPRSAALRREARSTQLSNFSAKLFGKDASDQ